MSSGQLSSRMAKNHNETGYFLIAMDVIERISQRLLSGISQLFSQTSL